MKQKDAGRKMIDTLKMMNVLAAVANEVAPMCLDTTEEAVRRKKRKCKGLR